MRGKKRNYYSMETEAAVTLSILLINFLILLTNFLILLILVGVIWLMHSKIMRGGLSLFLRPEMLL